MRGQSAEPRQAVTSPDHRNSASGDHPDAVRRVFVVYGRDGALATSSSTCCTRSVWSRWNGRDSSGPRAWPPVPRGCGEEGATSGAGDAGPAKPGRYRGTPPRPRQENDHSFMNGFCRARLVPTSCLSSGLRSWPIPSGPSSLKLVDAADRRSSWPERDPFRRFRHCGQEGT